MPERCVCCGEIIPEGRQVCPNCENAPMREKLRDLISLAFRPVYAGELRTIDDIADFLIAKGVTVQKWIPVTERLPKEEGWYLVYTTPNKGYRSINKAKWHREPSWTVSGGKGYWHGSGGIWTNVTHWMPLPEPPKGE